MMTEPFGNIPKILLKNIQDGFVMRYFIRHVSRRDVLEIDQKQFDVFSRNKLYETFSLKWFITNNAVERNSASVTLYAGTTSVSSISPQMKDGLKRILRVPSQFVIAQAKPVTQSLQLPTFDSITVSQQTTVVAPATFISGSPTTLTFNYEIGSTVPNSQSISVTSDGAVSNLYIDSGSSWLSASLMDTTTPTTVWVYPIVTGLYSGSYSSTVTIDSTQSGIDTTTVSIIFNVTNNPDVLFTYAPGMSLSSAIFSRNSIATYNEVV